MFFTLGLLLFTNLLVLSMFDGCWHLQLDPNLLPKHSLHSKTDDSKFNDQQYLKDGYSQEPPATIQVLLSVYLHKVNDQFTENATQQQ